MTDSTPATAAHCVPVRRNINESVPRDWTEQELRGGALRDALSYFTYVTSRAPVTGPAQPPVGITTVLEIADHFAAYVRDGSKPQKEATDGKRETMFANPYNACTTCGVRVTDYLDNANVPCGHKGYDRFVEVGSGNAVPVKGSKPPTWTEHVEPWKSICPSWGPVDGCSCEPTCPLPPVLVGADPNGV